MYVLTEEWGVMLSSGAGHFTVSFRVRMEQFAEENTWYVFSNFIVKITYFQSSIFNMNFDDYSQKNYKMKME